MPSKRFKDASLKRLDGMTFKRLDGIAAPELPLVRAEQVTQLASPETHRENRYIEDIERLPNNKRPQIYITRSTLLIAFERVWERSAGR
jgi:hypothetical protein